MGLSAPLLVLLGWGASVQAYDLTRWLSLGDVVAAGWPCQLVTDDSGS